MTKGSAIRFLSVTLSLAIVPTETLAQSGSNQWDPYAAPQGQNQAAQFAPPKYIGDAPIPVAPASQQPTTPSRFAPPELDRQLDGGLNRPAPAPAQAPQPQFNAPQQISPPGYGSGGFAPAQGFNPGYGAPFSGNGYGGYPPGFNGYPQNNGNPQGYGGYPGFGSNGAPSPFGFPGNFGNFPGGFPNGGMPGFGFSPFGFF